MYGYYPIQYNHYYFRQETQWIWTPSKVELNRKLRALWEQHIYWTRLTVNSIVGKLPDVEPTTNRLLRNPDDFAAVLSVYYGPELASDFAKLFREHLTIAAELTTQLRDGKTKEAAETEKRWYANADAIAAFLARINPYWSQKEWQQMLYEHLKLLTEEVAARIAGDYVKNVATNMEIEPQALEMADMMTTGIVQQFPGSFVH
ncbi:hypothetical protein [Paenibacillus pinihumi]|uniref:hypothetical protein n=1 Tax=Paenibacillus pinihumi TaxID=669462 RepID=UPI00041F1903|nr:hypothetical protein [Paenibacillus pinihumi]